MRCTLTGMADDFTGVPTEDFLHLHDEMTVTRLIALMALLMFALLAFALIRSGVLPRGWLLPGHAHG